MSTVIIVGKRKSQSTAPQSAQEGSDGKPPVAAPQKKKKGDGRSFRLNDKQLAYKLRMIVQDGFDGQFKSVADFVEPRISGDIEIFWSALLARLNRLDADRAAADAKKKAE